MRCAWRGRYRGEGSARSAIVGISDFGEEGKKSVSALSDLRVLELSSGVAAEYCGKLLADFGARVIKVEPPGSGSRHRAMGPFAPAGEPTESSGLFAYLNTNKQSVVLDPASPGGQQALRTLIGSVDVVIDDHPKGWLESLGIDPATCASQHPALILCSITPFGYEAPAALQIARSMNVLHSSWGYHSPCQADSAKPPLKRRGAFPSGLRVGPQSRRSRLVAAVYWRESSGRGQFIDVSQQASMASLVDYVLGQMVAGTMEVSARRQAYDLGGPATFFQCRDGYVYLWMSEPGHWNGMSTLMGEPAWMREYPERWLELHLTPERIDRCRAEIARWMKDQSKSEVASRAQKLGVPLVPVNTMEDVFRSSQMEFRKFFTQIEHPTLGRLHYPTVPYRLSATPARIEQARAAARAAHRSGAARSGAAARCPQRPGRVRARRAERRRCAARGPAAGRAGTGSHQDLGRTLYRQAPGFSRRRGHPGRELRFARCDARLRQQGHQRRAGISGHQPRQVQRSAQHEGRGRTAARARSWPRYRTSSSKICVPARPSAWDLGYEALARDQARHHRGLDEHVRQ